jgi:hypothetical protein
MNPPLQRCDGNAKPMLSAKDFRISAAPRPGRGFLLEKVDQPGGNQRIIRGHRPNVSVRIDHGRRLPPRIAGAASSRRRASASSSSVLVIALPFTRRQTSGHVSRLRCETGKHS